MKELVDEWFSNEANWNSLYDYASKLIRKRGSRIIPNDIVTDSYVYVLKKDIDPVRGNIESLCKGFIKLEVNFSNSRTNRELKKLSSLEYLDIIPDDSSESTIYTGEDIIELFVKSLSLYEKGLWNIYYNLNMNTCKKITIYKRLSFREAGIVLKEAKALELRLREFIKKIYKDED